MSHFWALAKFKMYVDGAEPFDQRRYHRGEVIACDLPSFELTVPLWPDPGAELILEPLAVSAVAIRHPDEEPPLYRTYHRRNHGLIVPPSDRFVAVVARRAIMQAQTPDQSAGLVALDQKAGVDRG